MINLYYDCFKVLKNTNVIDGNTIIIIETSIDDDVEKVCKLGFEITRVKEYKNQKHTFLKIVG